MIHGRYIYKDSNPRIDGKMNLKNEAEYLKNEIFEERRQKQKDDNLRTILEYLQRNEYVFKDESITYCFKQAVAILNHVALKGLNNSPYGLDGNYLGQKIDRISEEIKA
jgi:hypothetical protein